MADKEISGVKTCKMYRDIHGIWNCRACEEGADKITGNDGPLDSWIDSWAPNYCPYCGAKVLWKTYE